MCIRTYSKGVVTIIGRDSFKAIVVCKHASYLVMSSYWMDQATFNIAKEYPNTLPPESSFIYKFPSDLLAPDLIFYLNTPREEPQGNFVDHDFNRK